MEDISRRNAASMLQIGSNARRTIYEIMGWQGDAGSGSGNVFDRLRRRQAEAAARIERLRAETLRRLFGGVRAEAPSPSTQLALPPAEEDVIEAELVDDGEVSATSSRSSVVSDAELHRDYMELFGITDPDAARKKNAEIQRKERERIAKRR